MVVVAIIGGGVWVGMVRVGGENFFRLLRIHIKSIHEDFGGIICKNCNFIEFRFLLDWDQHPGDYKKNSKLLLNSDKVLEQCSDSDR